MKDLLIQDIMVRHVVSVREDATLVMVEELIRINKIRHIPVVNDRQQVVGIITQRDLLRNVNPRKTEDGYYFERSDLEEFILKHIMTPDPVTMHPEDPLVRAIEVMARDKFGCVPIVDGNRKLTGIITQIDILRMLYKALTGS